MFLNRIQPLLDVKAARVRMCGEFAAKYMYFNCTAIDHNQILITFCNRVRQIPTCVWYVQCARCDAFVERKKDWLSSPSAHVCLQTFFPDLMQSKWHSVVVTCFATSNRLDVKEIDKTITNKYFFSVLTPNMNVSESILFAIASRKARFKAFLIGSFLV